MDKEDDIDHEVRNTIVKVAARIHRMRKAVREMSHDIEKDLEYLHRKLEELKDAITIDPYP